MPTDKNKNKKSASKSNSPKRGQQLSDKLAAQVAKKKMTYAQAKKKQAEQDAKVKKTTHVKVKTRGSSQKLASKSKYKKAKFKIDKNGNMVAY